MTETAPTQDYSQYLEAPLLQRSSEPLKRKSALITGGTEFNGIGFGIAERFALEGASPIVLVGTKNSADRAPLLEQRLRMYGGDAQVLIGDVTSEADCVTMMEDAYSLCDDNVDILVNNAGTSKDESLSSVTIEDFEAVLNTKVKGAFLITREWFRPRNEANLRGGRIINIGSVVGTHGNFGQIAYAMANGALATATKVWALELGRREITVNLIAPGFVEGTNMTKDMTLQQIDGIKAVTPLKEGRARQGVMMTPQDVAGLALYLAGSDGAKMNGAIIPLDGALGSNYTAFDGLTFAGYRKVPSFALSILDSLTKEEVDIVKQFRASGAEGAGNA